MNRASKLSLAGFAWMITFVAVLVFAAGYKVEAQDNDQQIEVQQSQSDEQVQPQEDNQGEQNQEEAEPEQNQEDGQNQNNNQNQNQGQNQDDQQASDEGSYEYVAQPGDSYTLMARKAVQTYGLTNEVNLSIAEIVYAETQLVKEAGEPMLEVGQLVQFQVSDVGQAVQEAQNLSDEKEAMWNTYALAVPTFNTDNVGEGSVQAATTETDDGEVQDDSKEQQEQDDQNDDSSGDVKGASDETAKGEADEGGK